LELKFKLGRNGREAPGNEFRSFSSEACLNQASHNKTLFTPDVIL
jgi:hypothetical protein